MFIVCRLPRSVRRAFIVGGIIHGTTITISGWLTTRARSHWRRDIVLSTVRIVRFFGHDRDQGTALGCGSSRIILILRSVTGRWAWGARTKASTSQHGSTRPGRQLSNALGPPPSPSSTHVARPNFRFHRCTVGFIVGFQTIMITSSASSP